VGKCDFKNETYTKDYNMNTTTKSNQITELVQVNWNTKIELIKAAQNKLNSDDYIELTNFLRTEFKVDISQDDVVKYLEPIIYSEERKLIHELYGMEEPKKVHS
jgi:hypothetical protein